MAIRPIDMQTMIPKIPEIAKTNRLDSHKSALAQQQLQNKSEKDTAKINQRVIKSEENDKTRNNDDAKDKGKNQYKKHKDHQKNDSGEEEIMKRNQKPYHKIDIKI